MQIDRIDQLEEKQKRKKKRLCMRNPEIKLSQLLNTLFTRITVYSHLHQIQGLEAHVQDLVWNHPLTSTLSLRVRFPSYSLCSVNDRRLVVPTQ